MGTGPGTHIQDPFGAHLTGNTPAQSTQPHPPPSEFPIICPLKKCRNSRHEPPSQGVCILLVWAPVSPTGGGGGRYFLTIWMTSSCSMVCVRPTRCGLYLVLVPWGVRGRLSASEAPGRG